MATTASRSSTYEREDEYGRIVWTHAETGLVVSLARRSGPAARRMTRATASSPTDTWYELYVRPAPGEPALHYEELRGHDKEHAIERAREFLAEHPEGEV